ncbi:nucleotide exchange factor GrpE [uncultured Jatrophihabitans sp.]|uniref:nucleotide exchange factor GrpE n=1 Tax=uncultured Jatrophihabitans sp. TaxID=1610747 RepID=UPI0035CB071B
MTSAGDPREPEEPPIRFTDNRKVKRDATGTAVVADEVAVAAEVVGEAAPTVAASLLDERTADLQRVQAEYANYRKRAERDRLQAGDAAVARVLGELLPVIDDLERAKAHDDLTGPLKAVADKLESVTTKLGLTAFGEVGDPFDPSRHEAVLHDESSDVTVPTCTTVMRPGYTVGDRLLRPAMVGVSDPASSGNSTEGAATSESTAEVPAGTSATPLNDEAEGNQPPVS